MKKKLIAAVTSLVMVATMVPATVSATTGGAAPAATKAAQTKGQDEIDAFKAEVKKLPDVASITEYNAATVLTAYKVTDTKYKALGSADYAAVQNEITKMEAVKDKLITIYVAKMTTEIDKVAQPGKVSDTEGFSTITSIETNLETDLGLTVQDVKRKVANYAKYDDAKLAQAFAAEIAKSSYNWDDTVENLSGDSGVLATFEKTQAYKNVKDNPTAQTYASNYKKYADAVAKVQKDKDDKSLVKTYKDKVEAMATLLGKEPTEANIAKAEALLKEAEEKLKGINSSYTAGALYDNSKDTLKAAIEAAQTAVEDKKAADDFAAKVTAVGTVELNDMAKLQEIFRLQTALTGKLDPTVDAEATNKIGQLKTLIEKVPAADKEFTELVIASFPVPASGDVTADHDDQVTDAYTVLSNTTPRLVGVDISNKLDTDLPAYKTAKANVDTAYTALTSAKTAAEKVATDFITNVFVTLPKKISDADYELLLNKAKEDYNKLAARYKEGGVDYTKDDFTALASTGLADQGQSVKSAMAKLDEYFKALTGDATAEKDKALLKELFAGIDKLPAAAKLTIADKDTVYALRDKKDALSDKGLTTFTSTNSGAYNTTLTTAIQKIDQLVVADLIKQISALKEVKADAALADIQAAKKANKAARDAYDALTATQKKEVTNYAVLVGAEKAVEDAEIAYVKAQMKEIAALDTAKLTVAQAKTIVNLQEIIDDMTNEQVATIKADKNYKAYQTALAAAQAIVKKATDLEQATVTAIADQTYTGEAVEPAVEVKNAFDEVVPADAYKVTYKQNVNVGTAIVIIASTTEGGYTGSITATFEIKGIALKATDVTGVVSKTYTGKALTQKVVVKANGKTLKNGTDYTVSYKNNTAVGKAAVTVKAKGNYTGTITKTFIVKPAKESITSLKKGTKRFTVKYKKQSGAKYQIYYKTAGSKAKTVKTSAVTKTVKNLKKGKTYTVKVRAYKAIDGKTYYGAYSKAKKVKVR